MFLIMLHDIFHCFSIKTVSYVAMSFFHDPVENVSPEVVHSIFEPILTDQSRNVGVNDRCTEVPWVDVPCHLCYELGRGVAA